MVKTAKAFAEQPEIKENIKEFKVVWTGTDAAALLGGSGGAIGSVFGALILRVISFFFRIFDIAPLLQPLFEGIILLAAVSIGALRVLRVKNTLELFR